MTTLEDLRYPVGKFHFPDSMEPGKIPGPIAIIETFPLKLRQETASLDDVQLDTPYRENGWTIRQVVHHVADSHINSYCRFKLAMTEINPVIKPYFEDRWAALPDGSTAPVDYSLNIVDAIHARWVLFLKNLDTKDFDRTFLHPEHNRTFSLYQALCMYSWHCDHHLAHITSLKKRKGW